MKITIITSLTIIVSLSMISCGNEITNKTNEALIAEKKREIIFDVPSLIDKNIDEVNKIIGKPSNDSEPTKVQLKAGVDEWDKTYTKDGYELLISYNPNTRQVTDFFIGTKDSSGKTNDYEDLLQVTNMTENSSTVKVEPVKTIQNPEYYTGIIIKKK